MSTGNKLADLKALASSAVAEESSRAASMLKQPPPPDQKTDGRERPQPEATPKKASKGGRVERGAVTRVPSVLRSQDVKAINAAKIYLMQGSGRAVSTNNIIQMALRSMKIGPELLKLADEILAEDGRRK